LLLLLDFDHFHILPHFVVLLSLVELVFNTVCFNASLFINDDDAVADEAVVFAVALFGFTKYDCKKGIAIR